MTEVNKAVKPLVIYHANCIDGMGAGWAVWRYFGGNVDLHASSYGSLPPDVAGRVVYIVDFSYAKETLQLMGGMAKSITVLDHHKTAAADLIDFAVVGMNNIDERRRCPFQIASLFDMERSGAGIAWDFFNYGVKRPLAIDLIEDRDLWRFAFKETRAIHAALASYPMGNMDEWDKLMNRVETSSGEMEAEGKAIDRRHLQMVNDNIAACGRRMKIGGYDVPVCNAPYAFASDTGNILCREEFFAATYCDTSSGKRAFSLRSSDQGLDVSEIAKRFGGGGHRNAAGFTVKAGWEGDQEGE